MALFFHDGGIRRGEWSVARCGHTLTPRKTQYPFYRRLGGPQGQSGQVENLVPTGIRSQTVQPVVSRYTDWATRFISENRELNPVYTEKLVDVDFHDSSSDCGLFSCWWFLQPHHHHTVTKDCGCEVLMVLNILLILTVVWDVMLCSSSDSYQLFGETSCIHLQGGVK